MTLGLGTAGASSAPLVWIVALGIAGAGVGFGNTGSTGLLLEAVPSERIVTAMVVWSELGILGYLLGPLVGGAVTQAFGSASIGLVPLVAGIGVLCVLAWARRSSPGLPNVG